MHAGAKVLSKGLARGFHSNIPLQPFQALTAYPTVKRQTQHAALGSLSGASFRRFSVSAAPSPLTPAVVAAAVVTSVAVAATNDASASALSASPADEVPRVGRCGIGKPQGGGRWGVHSQPSTMTVQQVDGGTVGQAGEDAFFLADNNRAWGVADGVGGWASVEGSDSAAYSRTLMMYAAQAATRSMAASDAKDTKQPFSPTQALSNLFSSSSSPTSSASAASLPLRILDAAYSATAKHNIIGSTTACIVTYDPAQRKLHYANLGDSGFLLVRHGQADTIRSVEKQHSFNCPFQLGSQSGDRPSDAAVADVDVHDNDILVLATDGFFDNLHTHEIVNTCRQHSASHSPDPATASSVDPNALAEQLCREAYAAASDSKRDTPFSQYCRRYGKRHSGGKMDDISVVIVQFKVRAETIDAKVDDTQTPKSKL